VTAPAIESAAAVPALLAALLQALRIAPTAPEVAALVGPPAEAVPEPQDDAQDPTLALLTVEEAARRLRIGRTTCYALIRSGELESVPVGRLRRVPPEALHDYVAKLRRTHATTTAS
jgi:excisionase family DNA binding protein